MIGIGFAAYAEQGSPIYIANQNPFVQIFGLPKAEPGTITPKGKLNVGFLYYVSNNAISADEANGESIIWDGETSQYNFIFRYGVSDKLEIGIDVPFIQHSGGYLDGLIRQTHDILGMPNDRQNEFDKDQIHYLLQKNGSTLYEMDNMQRGLGDLRLTAAIPLLSTAPDSQRYLALRPQLKLPTGDPDHLLGSGGTDASMSLAYTDCQTLSGINTVLSANIGAIYMGNTDVLRDIQRHFAGYGGVSLDWLAMKNIEIKLQLDMHSAFYDSALKQLGTSMQLLGGGTIHLPGEVLLDLGMSQQLVTDATPDLGFYLFARRLF
jgi:hypothetical protein